MLNVKLCEIIPCFCVVQLLQCNFNANKIMYKNVVIPCFLKNTFDSVTIDAFWIVYDTDEAFAALQDRCRQSGGGEGDPAALPECHPLPPAVYTGLWHRRRRIGHRPQLLREGSGHHLLGSRINVTITNSNVV